MQLGRVLQQNSNLRPPVLSDWPTWIKFRKYINEQLKFKDIAESNLYKLISSLLIIAAFINAIFCIFQEIEICLVIDRIFINIFTLDLIFNIIAIGPENHFNKMFSGVDFWLLIIGFFLQFVTKLTRQDIIIRLVRIYKANYIL